MKQTTGHVAPRVVPPTPAAVLEMTSWNHDTELALSEAELAIDELMKTLKTTVKTYILKLIIYIYIAMKIYM